MGYKNENGVYIKINRIKTEINIGIQKLIRNIYGNILHELEL